MKHLKIASTLIAALMLASVVGCVSNTPVAAHETTGQYVDDAVITTGVKAAILGDATLKVAEINVETYKGVVQLSGFVRSQENIATAITLAQKVDGVKSVKNDMHLK